MKLFENLEVKMIYGIMLFLAFLIVWQIWKKVKQFDADMEEIYQKELRERNENKN